VLLVLTSAAGLLLTTNSDLHEANILLRLPHSIDNITLNQLYEKHGQPRREPITRLDGQPLDPWVPTHGVVPIWFGEESNTISLANSRIFLTDFGKSFQPAVDARLSHTPLLLRSPELLLDPSLPVSFPDEIWSLACAVFFIMGQRPPFESWFPTEDVFLDEHVDALCRSPKELWTRWSNRNGKFDDQLQRIDGRPRRLLEERLEYSIQEPRRDWNMAEMSEEEKHDFLVLIRSMLSFEPENRPSAQQVLESRWMQKWANPVWESTENNMKT
jgi:serine/threonine protein kinase